MKRLKIKRYKTLKIYLRMNVSKRYDNASNSLRTSKYNKLIDKVNGDLGLNSAKENENTLKRCVFNIVKRNSITNKLLVGYFVIECKSKPVTLFRCLEFVYLLPYRNMSYYGDLFNYNNVQMRVVLDALVCLGYLSKCGRPRKIMLLNSFTMDETYMITKQGIKVIGDIYERVGLV